MANFLPPEDIRKLSIAIVASATILRNNVTTEEAVRMASEAMGEPAPGAPVGASGERPEDSGRPKPSKTGLIPAVPIDLSVNEDYIVCLEDGKKMKMLKRHLRTAFGMTPAQYRKKWGLPDSYPMVAPGYSRQRALLAKKAGLGRVVSPSRAGSGPVPQAAE